MENRVELINKTEIRRIEATFEGTRDIMFDRYAGDNKTELEPWQKFYLDPKDGKTITLPSQNIMSALTAQNTDSWTKSLRDPRKYKKLCHAFAQAVTIEQALVPFLRDGKPIMFGKFVDDVDELSGAYIHRTVARLDKGIPNPKARPTLPCEWMLKPIFNIHHCGDFNEQDLVNIINEGFSLIGLGTFRRSFGRGRITDWKVLD